MLPPQLCARLIAGAILFHQYTSVANILRFSMSTDPSSGNLKGRSRMRRVLTLLVVSVIAVCLLPGGHVQAQKVSENLVVPAADQVQILSLDDGSTLVGRITRVGETDVTFQSNLGEMTIAIARITEIQMVASAKIKDGKYWFTNPNRTRLLVGPTARTLEAGAGYLFDLWIFFPGLAYGLTDNFTIMGGASIIPGLDNQLFYFNPKYGFAASDKLDVAASVLILSIWGETAYIGMGTATYGTDDYSLTGGLGLAWTDERLADKPAGTLGGEVRMSRRTALVGESWFIPGESGAIIMGGIRFFGEEITVDLGIGCLIEDKSDEYIDEYDMDDYVETETAWIPYIDFVYNF